MSESPTNETEIVASLEDDSGEFCVDILRHPEGHFTYVEYARDEEDEDAWHLRTDGNAKTYRSQFAAYSAATRDVTWLIE